MAIKKSTEKKAYEIFNDFFFNNKSNKENHWQQYLFQIKIPFKPSSFFFLTLHFSGDICHQIMELYLSGSIYLLRNISISFQALHFQV